MGAPLILFLGRRDRRALSPALVDRAVVSLDQTASQDPRLPRPLRKRRSPPDLCRDDRLSAAAHRRAGQLFASLALRFADLVRRGLFERRPLALIDKPPPRARPFGPRPKPTPFRLCLNFPRTALRSRLIGNLFAANRELNPPNRVLRRRAIPVHQNRPIFPSRLNAIKPRSA